MERPDDDPVSTTAASRTGARRSTTETFGRDTLAAISGIVATAAALGTSELLAGILPGATSLIASIGQVVVDLQPPGAKDFMVGLFGTNDKLALEVFIVIVSLVIGAGLGVLARRSFLVASLGFVAFGV